MTKSRFAYRVLICRLSTERFTRLSLAVWIVLAGHALGAGADCLAAAHPSLEAPIVVTQVPAGADIEKHPPVSGGMLRVPYGDGARLVIVSPNAAPRVLSTGFHSACDPDVSFDATRILFAGKRAASDPWDIYEMRVDGSGIRQVTKELGNCRSPGYQSSLYTLKPVGVPNQPEYHLTFVAGAGTLEEFGGSEATSLYSCKLDGSAVRRLTFNLSSDMDPFIMDNGRLVFAAWQRSRLDHGLLGRIGLFAVNIDGADYALYAPFEGRRVKHMPCVTAGGLVVFVEADTVPWDGAGCLACVTVRRPLHSCRQITGPADGLFHSPSPLPDGRILVSRRPSDGSGTHGVWRFDPRSKQAELVFDDRRYHEIQARLLHPRDEPDGRSTAVPEEQDKSELSGKFYCLSVHTSDLKPSWMPPGSVKRLRVLEGVPRMSGEWRVESGEWRVESGEWGVASGEWSGDSPLNGIPSLVQRRILGDIPVEEDGSFNIEVPANTPIELQTLDPNGMALRSCGWIWVKDYARQGCIGCHEDGELVPENSFVDAVQRPSISLCLPLERRRTVDFRRDVMPIVDGKCAPCHGKGGAPPRLDGGVDSAPGANGTARFNRAYESLLDAGVSQEPNQPEWKHVHPGRARTSPLVWHILGRNTSRPWDGEAVHGAAKPIPPTDVPPLTEDEMRTIIEWIDLGALWDGVPGPDDLPSRKISQ